MRSRPACGVNTNRLEKRREKQSCLRVVNNGDGVSTIYSDHCRRASNPKAYGARFQLDYEHGMHVTVYSDAKADNADQKRKFEQPAADAVFDGGCVFIS